MKLKTLDGSDLMDVTSLSRAGNNLLIDGVIMGSMPVRCVLTPTEARSVFKLMNFGTIRFLLTILFRS